MKRSFLLASLALAATAACAQQYVQAISNKPTYEAAIESKLSPVYTDGKCHFRLGLLPEQGYNNGTYMFFANNHGNPNGWGFGFSCHAGVSQADIDGLLVAKQVKGKWIWEATDLPFTPDQHFKAYKFSGKNWQGVATTYDDTTGDEITRGRNLFFCLMETNGPQVLCGGPISVMALVDPPSTSSLPKIMAVLKTIEFVDQPAHPSAASSTATAR